MPWRTAVVRIVPLVIFIATSAVFIALEKSPIGHNILISERGVVEIASAACWILAALVCVANAATSKAARIDFLLLAYFTLALGARELDVQKQLTSWNLTKLLNYFKPHIPLHERLLVLAFVLAPAVIALAFAVMRWGPRLRAGWRGGDRAVRDALVWCGALFAVLVADKLTLVLNLTGGVIENRYPARVMEETAEACLALYTLLVVATQRARRPTEGPERSNAPVDAVSPFL